MISSDSCNFRAQWPFPKDFILKAALTETL